jgi:N-acetyl-gamma-glutamyl-phosphate reductase
MTSEVAAAVYGGSGYVAGELLRLLALHPKFEPTLVYSTSQAGELVTSVFPHLAGTKLDSLRFTAEERSFDPRDGEGGLAARGGPLAVFTATPHGAAAPIVKKLFAARSTAKASDADFHVVDLSADFRFPDAKEWAAIYGKPHAAPELLPQFVCAVPEQVERSAKGGSSNFQHAAQPGCFTTATVCAAWPFFELGLVEGDVFVSAVTGSSGSGRTPAANTHHPDRHATLYAYNALAHRHEPEMRRLIGLAKAASETRVEFVPHSGPFVRGIHATVRMTLLKEASTEELVERVNALQRARSRFVVASVAAPKLTEVVGTNRCRLGVATRGRTLVVTSVIDNLTKGAAGGAIQWMNRLFRLPDETGLESPGLGWY